MLIKTLGPRVFKKAQQKSIKKKSTSFVRTFFKSKLGNEDYFAEAEFF